MINFDKENPQHILDVFSLVPCARTVPEQSLSNGKSSETLF